MKQNTIRTDLAMEAAAGYGKKLKGVRVREQQEGENIKITRVEIMDDEGEKALGKPQGNYITIDAPKLRERDAEYEEQVTGLLARELGLLLGPLGNRDTVLIVGLGNRAITPDALGPEVVEGITVSRHVTEYLPEQVDERVKPVCAIAPGVLGVTGIETGEVVRGLVEKIRPRVVIAIDALASRSTERISTSIQLSDTGIQPGAGLGNRRMELSRKTLGVKVIALGMPTVVHAATISQDAVSMLLEKMGSPDAQQEQMLIDLVGEIVSERIGPLVVTPKEIDQIISDSARVLSGSINMAVHGVTLEELRRFLH